MRSSSSTGSSLDGLFGVDVESVEEKDVLLNAGFVGVFEEKRNRLKRVCVTFVGVSTDTEEQLFEMGLLGVCRVSGELPTRFFDNGLIESRSIATGASAMLGSKRLFFSLTALSIRVRVMGSTRFSLSIFTAVVDFEIVAKELIPPGANAFLGADTSFRLLLMVDMVKEYYCYRNNNPKS